jgi:hypothetical protein
MRITPTNGIDKAFNIRWWGAASSDANDTETGHKLLASSACKGKQC